MGTASVGEIDIAYDDQGTGKPLVLVHGHPFDRSMWQPQIDYFSDTGWRVVAPDLRGYGKTTVVPGKTPLSTFARDLAALLGHLGIEAFVLGGLSMGGQIVMECYRLFPERILGLLLADTSAHAETAGGKTRRHDAADRLLREGMQPFAEEVLPKMIAPSNIEAMPLVAKHVLDMMFRTPAQGAAAALRGRAERADYVEILEQVRVPSLVVVGSQDEFTPIEDARTIHERIPASVLAVIDGAAHMPNLERPREFNDALTWLLGAVDSNTGPVTHG